MNELMSLAGMIAVLARGTLIPGPIVVAVASLPQ